MDNTESPMSQGSNIPLDQWKAQDPGLVKQWKNLEPETYKAFHDLRHHDPNRSLVAVERERQYLLRNYHKMINRTRACNRRFQELSRSGFQGRALGDNANEEAEYRCNLRGYHRICSDARIRKSGTEFFIGYAKFEENYYVDIKWLRKRVAEILAGENVRKERIAREEEYKESLREQERKAIEAEERRAKVSEELWQADGSRVRVPGEWNYQYAGRTAPSKQQEDKKPTQKHEDQREKTPRPPYEESKYSRMHRPWTDEEWPEHFPYYFRSQCPAHEHFHRGAGGPPCDRGGKPKTQAETSESEQREADRRRTERETEQRARRDREYHEWSKREAEYLEADYSPTIGPAPRNHLQEFVSWLELCDRTIGQKGDKATIRAMRPFPEPPAWPCNTIKCNAEAHHRKLQACTCNIVELCRLYGNECSEGFLKMQMRRWHPDNFSGCIDAYAQRKAEELFKAFGHVLSSKK